MSKASAILSLLNEDHSELAKTIKSIINESGDPSEDDLKKYKTAAKKMVDNIKARSPDWTDPNGEVEKAFYDNMVAMKKGEL
jgi:ElaB/YqjD/DUF883 family membrane-anchored ribosome-binding protein